MEGEPRVFRIKVQLEGDQVVKRSFTEMEVAGDKVIKTNRIINAEGKEIGRSIVTSYRDIAKEADKTARAQERAAEKAKNAQIRAHKEMQRALLASMGSAGSSLTYGVTVPGLIGIGFLDQIGTDAIEAKNLIHQVFGSMTQDVENWAARSSASLIQTRLETQKTAATFFLMSKEMGLAPGQALNLSERLTERAADVASFRNLRPEESIEKFQAALTGEYEPLKRLGIVLSENRVKEEAYAAGIAKRGVELTESQKVMARYNLIMRQTTKDEGDVTRTINEGENVRRHEIAQIKEKAQALGEKLTPALNSLISEGGPLDKLVDKSAAAVDWYVGLTPGEQDVANLTAFAGLLVGPALTGITGIATQIEKLSKIPGALQLLGTIAASTGNQSAVGSAMQRFGQPEVDFLTGVLTNNPAAAAVAAGEFGAAASGPPVIGGMSPADLMHQGDTNLINVDHGQFDPGYVSPAVQPSAIMNARLVAQKLRLKLRDVARRSFFTTMTDQVFNDAGSTIGGLSPASGLSGSTFDFGRRRWNRVGGAESDLLSFAARGMLDPFSFRASQGFSGGFTGHGDLSLYGSSPHINAMSRLRRAYGPDALASIFSGGDPLGTALSVGGSALGGPIGGLLGGVAGRSLGKIGKWLGFGGGGGRDGQTEATALIVSDPGQQEMLSELVNITRAAQLRSAGIGIDNLTADVAMQNARAGLIAEAHS